MNIYLEDIIYFKQELIQTIYMAYLPYQILNMELPNGPFCACNLYCFYHSSTSRSNLHPCNWSITIFPLLLKSHATFESSLNNTELNSLLRH